MNKETKKRESNIKRRFQKLGFLFLDEPLGAIGAILFLVLISMAVASPLWTDRSPIEVSISNLFKPPSSEFWFGSDNLGRDVWSRFIYGSRTSLFVGVSSILLASITGGMLGIFSGLIGGRVDLYIQRIMDALLGMPAIVLAILIMAALGTSVMNTILAIAVAYFPRINRLTRSTAVSLRESLFVESAVVAGASKIRISIMHVAPNCVAPWLVYATALLGTAFLAEATLSFLGLGVPPPIPSWGRDLSESLPNFEFAPWLCLFPGLGITMAVFASNFLGDSMRNIFDPRLKKA
ncbi:ABC transporter permease [Thermodesulfobacteriota bacterium]